ncbi:unnamed protein product [Darwinula stevensoni]|uniref:Plasminogen n=1 Tax=Darwinula stevensoni TaxID=69355 RepID=A0A7R9AEV1_9CRUS|nr:unnamed protein product [Darwinula stevensoni]CAG0901736.1 unnamed protein product [Darwinula stevensoni]
MRYDNVALTSAESSLRACTKKCLNREPPCYAFNYRESDGLCQIVGSGTSGVVEEEGFSSYVQEFCLREYPKIQNAVEALEGWDGNYPVTPRGRVVFRCEYPGGFSDGSSVHTAECSSLPDTWYSSFKEDQIQCKKKYVYPECRVTVKGREYVGKVNKTETGRDCLNWYPQPYENLKDFSGETYDSHFHNLDSWSQQAYCRNPSGKEKPWCFISDRQLQWEYCDIPMCTDPVPPECKVTQQGGEYIGKKRVTFSGFLCEPWRNTQYGSVRFMDEIGEDYNFCRNPIGDISPWCYHASGWEYCNIPFCDREVKEGAEGNVYPECRKTEKGKEYVGRKNETETGKPCLHWVSQPYGMPWDFWHSANEYEGCFLNWDVTSQKNYCRNPGIHRERPWCFVSDPNIQFEYCDIPFCHDLNPPECKLTEGGGEYAGRKNVSLSGFPCRYWLAQVSQVFGTVSKYFSALSDEIDGNHNFCRNSEGSFHGPSCVTQTDSGVRWEYCDVPFCPAKNGEQCSIRKSGKCVSPVECKTSTRGTEYMGTKNVTKSGHPCQPWMRNTPNNIQDERYTWIEGFPDDLHPAHNFCRNPTAIIAGPWCWNGAGTSPSKEQCSIPTCIDANDEK